MQQLRDSSYYYRRVTHTRGGGREGGGGRGGGNLAQPVQQLRDALLALEDRVLNHGGMQLGRFFFEKRTRPVFIEASPGSIRRRNGSNLRVRVKVRVKVGLKLGLGLG